MGIDAYDEGRWRIVRDRLRAPDDIDSTKVILLGDGRDGANSARADPGDLSQRNG